MAAIDHPTTRRENRSSTTARYSHPSGVGLSGTEVPLEQVGSHLCPWLTLCGHRAMTWTSREESLFSHQTGHPLARTRNALCMEFRMNTWTAIHTAIGLESRLHFLGKVAIFPVVLTHRALPPGVVSTH